jgi:hypothetical protein
MPDDKDLQRMVVIIVGTAIFTAFVFGYFIGK